MRIHTCEARIGRDELGLENQALYRELAESLNGINSVKNRVRIVVRKSIHLSHVFDLTRALSSGCFDQHRNPLSAGSGRWKAYDRNFTLVKEFHLTIFCTSIEWSPIYPLCEDQKFTFNNARATFSTL